MEDTIQRSGWANYLVEFNKRNQSRPTWLQVFGEAGAQSEAQGLRLSGISFEEKGNHGPCVQIMLIKGGARDAHHLTHAIPNVARMMLRIGMDGRDEAIEFVDMQGEASLLLFEHQRSMAAHA